MLLTVDHLTRYAYDRPVRTVVQSHRLTPSRFDGQRVLDWVVTVSDGVAGGAFRDGAGDWVQGWSVAGPVSGIEVRVQGRVETSDLAGVLRGHRELVQPECYLRDTTQTRADAALRALAESCVDADVLARAHAMSAAVSEAIAYLPGATTAATTAAEALALGKGVCQDHAHALIAAARAVGMPARYASGYLSAALPGAGQSQTRSPAGQSQSQSQSQNGEAESPAPDLPHEAAHAWAEIHVAGLGWVGFDPANRCCPDARYIRLGSGLDAQDAAPIRGIARGAGRESLDVTVAVLAEQQ